MEKTGFEGLSAKKPQAPPKVVILWKQIQATGKS